MPGRTWMLWVAGAAAAVSMACGIAASGEEGGAGAPPGAGTAAAAAPDTGGAATDDARAIADRLTSDPAGGTSAAAAASFVAGAGTAAAGDAGSAGAGDARSPAAADTGRPVAAAAPRSLQKEFPPTDYLQRIVIAYQIAHSRPELLEGLPCYCPCELYGHGGVLDCYRSQHAAMCSTCLDIGVAAGQLYSSQAQAGTVDMEQIRQAVKDRYRRAVASQILQELPMSHLPGANAYVQVCSDCHQPPAPAMHSAGDWATSLQRMEAYARQSDRMPPDSLWQAAVSYLRSIAVRYPADVTDQVRSDLQATVDRLKVDEGDSAYYPSARDEVLDPAWAEHMADAYRIARDLPADLLASTETTCSSCATYGHTTLLECLNSWHAITCEESVEQVHQLAVSR